MKVEWAVIASNCLKVTVIINKVFRPQKTLKKTRIKLCDTPAFQLCYTAVEIGLLKRET
jgi:hypothetical protein